ncbi:MAG: 3-phosphoshikimate 1-carboxyvinyltransferase [Bacteroidota bacterium]|jgi:3-phosphoshikimate 1-carboxyvinyltransferase
MKIKGNNYRGTLQAPGSKSHAQRLLLLACLSKKPSQIHGFHRSADNLSMLAALEHFGHKFQALDTTIMVQPSKHKSSHLKIDIGESGFGLRTLAFVGNCFSESFVLEGQGTLKNREHWASIESLQKLGLEVLHQEGKLPLQVKGKIKNFNLNLDGSSGSQHLSGLFLLAAATEGTWQISIENLKSAPYFEWTLRMLQEAGFQYQKQDNNYFFRGAQELQLANTAVEGDWSSVAAHLVAAAISGEILVDGLNPNSLQADQALLEILTDFGAHIEWRQGKLLVSESVEKKPFHTNLTDCPDLFPVLVILACACNGSSQISGITRLQNKESDRLAVMCEALSAWDIPFEIDSDTISIHGKGKLPKARLKSHHDHRIAMAISIASLISEAGQEIDDITCLNKSYPGFYQDFQRLSGSAF